MAPDKKPGRGEKSKSPKIPTSTVRPDLSKKPATTETRGKTSGTTKR
jgi:hypothetical protein